jgi:hypothetical protein
MLQKTNHQQNYLLVRGLSFQRLMTKIQEGASNVPQQKNIFLWFLLALLK